MPSLDLSSCHSPSASPTPPGSGAIRGVKSMSVPSYPRSQGSVSSPRAPPVTSPRQPPSFGRSHSFKSPLPRGEKTNLQTKVLTLAICVSVAGVRRSSQAAQSDGSSQSSSASLVRAAPPLAPFTGLTPPTKETRGVTRSRSSAGANSQEIQRARRSLETNTTLAAVRDEDMQRDLENYFQRFGNIQRDRGKQ